MLSVCLFFDRRSFAALWVDIRVGDRGDFLFHPRFDRRAVLPARARGWRRALAPPPRKEGLGQLVPLGFGVATFTPAAYRRPGLGRPL